MNSATRVLANIDIPSVDGFIIRPFGAYRDGATSAQGQAGFGSKPWRAEHERRRLADILPLIPSAERPDILLISSPEYLPIPIDLASFPGPKVLLITDWNVCLRFLPDLCPLFDFCFTDWPGYRLLRKAGLDNVHHQPLFGHDPARFRFLGYPAHDRNLDVSFCGNLNAGLHGERNRLIARLARWSHGLPALDVRSGLSGEGGLADRRVHLGQAFDEAYVDILNRSRLVFNYAIRKEANMRLFEAMACGAVPLVEEGNQEAAILFQEGKHYFRYSPDALEARVEALLADPARIEEVARNAREEVARHTKASQIRALLETVGRERAKQAVASIRPSSPSAAQESLRRASQDSPPPDAGSATGSVHSLIKLRVLGAGYTLQEALQELQNLSPAHPGLDRETLPALLFVALEKNTGSPMEAVANVFDLLLSDENLPPIQFAFLRMKLASVRKQWEESIAKADLCLQTLDALEQTADPSAIRNLYGHFYPPIDLGKGFNTDLNLGFRDDLATGKPGCYLGLLRAHCHGAKAKALLALDRPGEAMAWAERIPARTYASCDPHEMLAEGYRRAGETSKLRGVLEAWFAEKPLDSEVWNHVLNGWNSLGDRGKVIAHLEDLLLLARFFLTPEQVAAVQSLLDREKAKQ